MELDQKKIFLNSEGDFWYERNRKKLNEFDFKNDLYTKKLINIIKKNSEIKCVLDVGCSDGSRINYLKQIFKKVKFSGIDPSKKAIKFKKFKYISLKVGTADRLEFSSNKFDLIMFSFCLYLCDDKYLKKIIDETIRVSKKKSFILINDFYFKGVKYLKYKHKKNIRSRKMDYSKIFTNNKKISLISKKIYTNREHNLYKNQKLNELAVYTLLLKKDKN